MIDKAKLQATLNHAIPGEWPQVISTSSLVDDTYRVVLKHERETGNVHVTVEDANTDKVLAGTSTLAKNLRKDAPCVEIITAILVGQINQL